MCRFCDQLKDIQDYKEYYKKKNYITKYTTSLVAEDYYEDNFTGEVKYSGFKLNYCPECGRKLNLKEDIEDEN